MSPGRLPGKAGSVAITDGGAGDTGGDTEGVGGMGGLAHEASRALAIISGKLRSGAARLDNLSISPENFMTLLLLEALGALLIFVFIIWWTMFSGRKNGELKDSSSEKEEP